MGTTDSKINIPEFTPSYPPLHPIYHAPNRIIPNIPPMEHSTKSSENSVALRKAGNQLFKLACSEDIPQVYKIIHIEKALRKYQQSSEMKCSVEEKLAAWKNILVASSRLILLLDYKKKDEKIQYWSVAGVNAGYKAYVHSVDVKDDEWRRDVLVKLEVMEESVIELVKIIKYQTLRTRDIINQLEDDYFRCGLCFSLCRSIFSDALRWEENYGEAFSVLQDCHFYIVSASQFNISERYLFNEIDDLSEAINIQLCICESRLAMGEGDINLDIALFCEDEVKRERFLYIALDFYRYSITYARNLDIECEAIALSHIGKIFGEGFDNKKRANVYFNQSIVLAISTGRTFGTAWHDYAVTAIQDYREQEELRREEERRDAETDYRPELQTEFDAFIGLNQIQFLKHIYSTHPPNDTDVLEEDLSTEPNRYNAVRNAILQYHPDKQKGGKRKCLCGEITAILNSHYTDIKNKRAEAEAEASDED